MEVALQQAPTLVVVDDEARLAHALRLARGFALFFVRCNIPLYRDEVVARLKEELQRPVVEVDLTEEPEVYPAIARAAESSPEESALFIYGLEAHLPSADREQALQTLRDLKWRRAAYQRLARPLVFWLPEYALNLIAQEAPDFYDWNSGVFELHVPEPVRETLLAVALEVLEAGDFLSLSAEEKESRIQLLEGLWEEYREERPAEQRARLRIALQLGELYLSLGRQEEAQSWLTKAQRLVRALGDQVAQAQTVSRLGFLAQALGNLAGARECYERALLIDEAAFGPDHPNVARDLNNLGWVLRDLGDLAGARACFERALRIDEAAFGPDHPYVARDLNNLGEVLRALGDLAGARACFERALGINEATLGPDHPRVAATLNNLGSVLRDLGDLAGARACYERALRIDEAAFGPDHPSVARDVNNLGDVLYALGDLEGAIRLYQRSLEIWEVLGDPRGRAATLAMMGQVLLAWGKLPEGIQALRQALEILQRIGARADAERVAGILAQAQQMRAGADHE